MLNYSPTVITGATGYIASNFINFLHEHGLHENHARDLLLVDRTLKLDRFYNDLTEDLCDEHNLHKLDLNSGEDEKRLIQLIKDHFHKTDHYNPIFIHTANLHDLEKEKLFLKNIQENFPNKYFVYLSSAAVYGDSNKQHLSEDEETNPISEYGKYKLEIEKEVERLFPNHLILRIANPFGNEPDSRGVIKIFQEKIKSKLEVQINSEKENQIIRDFIHIKDLSQSIFTLMKVRARGICNIGSGTATSLDELAKSINPKTQIKYAGYKDGDIKYSVLDISKLELFYKPKPPNSYLSRSAA